VVPDFWWNCKNRVRLALSRATFTDLVFSQQPSPGVRSIAQPSFYAHRGQLDGDVFRFISTFSSVFLPDQTLDLSGSNSISYPDGPVIPDWHVPLVYVCLQPDFLSFGMASQRYDFHIPE